MKCAILDDYQSVALDCADWSALPDEVEITVFSDPIPAQTLTETLSPFGIIVAMRERTRFDAALLDNLPNLRLLVTTGMRNAAIDLDAATRNGVTVSGAAGDGQPTSEHAWALLMALARRIPQEDANLRTGGWQRSLGFDLMGKTLGLIGFGKVGKAMATYASAFGMTTLAYSRSLTDAQAAERGAQRAASLEEVLSGSDIVSVNVTHTPQTERMIGAAQFAKMKPGALFINTSRAAVVDTDALIAALTDGTLGGAAVDVFDSEPDTAGNPLMDAPNTVLTPHLGYVTRTNYESYFKHAVEDIAGFLNGAPERVLNADAT